MPSSLFAIASFLLFSSLICSHSTAQLESQPSFSTYELQWQSVCIDVPKSLNVSLTSGIPSAIELQQLNPLLALKGFQVGSQLTLDFPSYSDSQYSLEIYSHVTLEQILLKNARTAHGFMINFYDEGSATVGCSAFYSSKTLTQTTQSYLKDYPSLYKNLYIFGQKCDSLYFEDRVDLKSALATKNSTSVEFMFHIYGKMVVSGETVASNTLGSCFGEPVGDEPSDIYKLISCGEVSLEANPIYMSLLGSGAMGLWQSTECQANLVPCKSGESLKDGVCSPCVANCEKCTLNECLKCLYGFEAESEVSCSVLEPECPFAYEENIQEELTICQRSTLLDCLVPNCDSCASDNYRTCETCSSDFTKEIGAAASLCMPMTPQSAEEIPCGDSKCQPDCGQFNYFDFTLQKCVSCDSQLKYTTECDWDAALGRPASQTCLERGNFIRDGVCLVREYCDKDQVTIANFGSKYPQCQLCSDLISGCRDCLMDFGVDLEGEIADNGFPYTGVPNYYCTKCLVGFGFAIDNVGHECVQCHESCQNEMCYFGNDSDACILESCE